MQAFFHQLLSGLADGAIYASVALALVMIFKATHEVNFAQGEMAMFSTYIALALTQAGVSYWVAFALTLVFSFVLGLAIQRLLLRPLSRLPHTSELTAVVVFIGLLVFFNGTAGWLFGYTLKEFPSPFDEHAWYASTYLSSHEIGMIMITMIVLAIVFAFFRFTRLGLAMRAAAENPQSSRLVGIRVGWMLALGWGLAAVLGAIAGMMAAHKVFLDPNMMGGVILYGFAAALLGGIDNPWGAPIGGFLIGVLVNLAGAYVVGSHLQQALALLVIVAVLVFKPSGLFGRTVVVRV
ncbi:MAG TPA: branched-chain amino acid ABC transporter permease [Kofleriaceae bacterium]|jgi:branched-chain amino acid transport system permease protein|nr:branched-chain amino acid ABC transporter permease [Kofleriaceae bacterium]